MRKLWGAILLTGLLGSTRIREAGPAHSYVFMWAGDSALKKSDFLAVIDADPASPDYGRVLTSVTVGAIGHPHHTEAKIAADGHLLANDFTLGHTWLFDLTDAVHPRALASFQDVAGFSHPHTFIRLADGRVLSTFQYKATGAQAHAQSAGMRGMPDMKMGASGGPHSTGGLVEMDERGRPIRSRSAADPAIRDTMIYPYSVTTLPSLDRAISTTTDMNLADSAATSQWIQIWRLSDLQLLHSIALPPGPRGDENKYTGEPLVLPDGRSVYVHTFNCGLYLVRGLASARPTTQFVYGFSGKDCGVPILTSHYWLQTVPDAHALVALDIANPEHPREVSRVVVGANEFPHWIAIDHTARRVVLNSAGHGSRLFIINFDPATGALTMDRRFHDVGSNAPGISMSGRAWFSGFTGTAIPHGSVFSN